MIIVEFKKKKLCALRAQDLSRLSVIQITVFSNTEIIFDNAE